MIVLRKLCSALALGLLLTLIFSGTAFAEPELGITLTRGSGEDAVPTTHSDERAQYFIAVQNTASANPTVGDELTCTGLSSSTDWFSVPSDSNLSVQWLRNGVPIPGATEKTYVVAVEDEGSALQCEVLGTNPTAEKVSIHATGAQEAGSNLLTDVITRAGTGTIITGSKTVTGVVQGPGVIGQFIVGQEVTAEGIPAGTTIVAIGSGTLELSVAATQSGSVTLRAGAQPLAAGQPVVGPGIPDGTTITAVNGQTVTLSASATENHESFGFYVPAGTTAASSAAISLPPAVVSPSPTPPPPTPGKDPSNPGSRPRVERLTGPPGEPFDADVRVCKPPTNWKVGASDFEGPWQFRWLRDGEPIAGATSAEYTPVEAEDKYAILQCEVIAKSGSGSPPTGGSTASVSPPSSWIVSSTPPSIGYRSLEGLAGARNLPMAVFSSATDGPVVVEIELPAGEETYVFSVSGVEGKEVWNCTYAPPSDGTHATARCERDDALAPGSSYPPIELVERPGLDAPDQLVTTATVSGGGAPQPATAMDEISVGPVVPFGFSHFSIAVADAAGSEYTQAGGHPDSVSATFGFTHHVKVESSNGTDKVGPTGYVRSLVSDTPPGFVGNPLAVPACPVIAEVVTYPAPTCPPQSAIGGITIHTTIGRFENLPIFVVTPEAGLPAEFGFGISQIGATYALIPELRPEDGYAIRLTSGSIPKNPAFLSAEVTLCGFGAKLGTFGEFEEFGFQGCRKRGEPEAAKKAFLTNPTRCSGGPPVTTISADSWEEPDTWASATATTPALTGCDLVPFEPEISFAPTSHQADSPTGLDVELAMPTEGLESPTGIAQANLDNATVTLPAGMALNPAVAAGLDACSPVQIGLGTNDPVTCPESSKVGTVEVETPLLKNPLKGAVYVARQGDNPYRSLLAVYLAFESKRDGILIKTAGKISPDPATGQLTAEFTENPQAPFSRLALHIAGGDRAPLINPSSCGTYKIVSRFSPWIAADPSNPLPAEILTETSNLRVTSGPGGGPCPAGALDPKLEAGLADPVAGTTSPFVLDLRREDGSQRFKRFDLTMPPGLTAYLSGVPYCPDAALAAVSEAEGTGQAEIDHPTCPAASQIGTVSVGAGAGPSPYYVNTGRAYLAGPYKGAPLSIAVVAPAVAGPFDLGSVVVRSGAYVDPETARITVKSDPVPTILHGISLDLRDIRVSIDRPHFTLAPTNCEAMSVGAEVTGESGGTAQASNRFQVGGCGSLAFKPKLKLSLKGSTKRTGHPGLKAVLTYPNSGPNANIARAQVNLPHSEFIDQGNLDKTCTRPVLLEGRCPSRSVYGHAEAWTPLLEKPLEGPVYLVGGFGYQLPALVAELNGQIRVVLKGKVDTGSNDGIRNTFEAVPDAPVSRFVLQMKGGKKYSLLENSENLCARPQKADARFVAQNGKVAHLHPKIAVQCKKHHRKSKQR